MTILRFCLGVVVLVIAGCASVSKSSNPRLPASASQTIKMTFLDKSPNRAIASDPNAKYDSPFLGSMEDLANALDGKKIVILKRFHVKFKKVGGALKLSGDLAGFNPSYGYANCFNLDPEQELPSPVGKYEVRQFDRFCIDLEDIISKQESIAGLLQARTGESCDRDHNCEITWLTEHVTLTLEK